MKYLPLAANILTGSVCTVLCGASTVMAQPDTAAGDLTGAALRTIVMLALVIGLMLGLVWLLRRLNLPMTAAVGSRRNLRVLESLSVAPRQTLMVVQAGSRVLLVGCCQQGMQFLTTLDEYPTDTAAAGPPTGPVSGLARLRAAVRRAAGSDPGREVPR